MLLIVAPGNGGDTPSRGISELVESSGGKVQAAGVCTSSATVGDGDIDTFSVVANMDRFIADRIVVRVRTVISGIRVKAEVRDSSNVLTIIIRDAARTETSSIESAVSRILSSSATRSGLSRRISRGSGGWGSISGWSIGRWSICGCIVGRLSSWRSVRVISSVLSSSSSSSGNSCNSG